MYESDFVGILIDQDLVVSFGREESNGFALRFGALIARPPATRPDRTRDISTLEFYPDAVADFGQEK